MMCFAEVFFGLILFETLCFLELDVCLSPSQAKKIFNYYVFRYVLFPFLSLSLWDSYNVRFTTLDVVTEVS